MCNNNNNDNNNSNKVTYPRVAFESESCFESISRQEAGLRAAGRRATSRMKAAPHSQSGKTTLWYSVASGSGLLLAGLSLSVCISVYLSTYVSECMSICLSIYVYISRRRGLTRTMAETTTPRQPSLPKTRLGSAMPVEVRPKAVCDGSAPVSPWRCQSMPWLRTDGVSTNGAAAEVMNVDRLGKRYALALLGR